MRCSSRLGIGLATAIVLGACTQHPVARPTIGPKPASVTAAAGSEPNEDGPQTGFHLVAEFPYVARLLPLGQDALLMAWDYAGQTLLSIEDNQLRFRPELSSLDQPARATSFISAAGGTWPDNAWLALSGTSDAGPASADVYQWTGEHWAKRHEHDSAVVAFSLWRGNLVMQGTFPSVPMLIEQSIDERSSTGTKSLHASVCNPGASILAPPLVRDGALSVFGYACGQNGAAPEEGMALLVETWSGDGKKSQQRAPLPGDSSSASLVVEQGGFSFVLPSDGTTPRRLARFVAGSWQTLTELPPELSLLESLGSSELWAVTGSKLQWWQGQQWSTYELPADALPSRAKWLAVWRRGPDDLWLLAGVQDKTWLFNTKDGKVATPLPNANERAVLAKTMTSPREDCVSFVDFLALQPFQLGEDVAVTLSPDKARRVFTTVLGKLGMLSVELVRHGCYGEDCIGAQVNNTYEAEAIYQGLLEQTKSVPELARAARAAGRCFPPPETEPFPLR